MRRYCLLPFISLTFGFSFRCCHWSLSDPISIPSGSTSVSSASAGKSFRIFHFPGVPLSPFPHRPGIDILRVRVALQSLLRWLSHLLDGKILVPRYLPPCGPRLAHINARVCTDNVVLTMACHAVSLEAQFCPLRERTFGAIADSSVSITLRALVRGYRDEGAAAQASPRPRNNIAVLPTQPSLRSPVPCPPL